VVEVIQYDQSVTANVLMVCNSAYFSLRRPVHSLAEALVRIGFNNLVEIILTRGTSFLFFQACQGYQLPNGELWRHSVACALLSQILADRLDQKKSPIQFTAALLHDVGKVVLTGFVKTIRRSGGGSRRKTCHRGGKRPRHRPRGVREDCRELEVSQDIVAGIRYHHNHSWPRNSMTGVPAYLCDVVALMTGIGRGPTAVLSRL
jgi:hypothetical protein